MNTRWIDRIIYGGALRQICVLALLACSLILISGAAVYWGSEHQMVKEEDLVAHPEGEEERTFGTSLWSVYNHFVDPGNQANVNKKDRTWAVLVSLFGSFVLGGLLISTISNIMERRVEECRNGLVHYRLSGHIVIIGADAMLASLVRQLCRREKKCTLLIQTAKDVNEARMSLFAKLDKEEEKRVVWVHAARNSKEELERLYVADAKEVFILGDSGELDDVEYYHDSMNVDCLNLIGEICREKDRKNTLKRACKEMWMKVRKEIRKAKEETRQAGEEKEAEERYVYRYREEPLRCNVLFEYQSTFSVFQFADIDEGIKKYIDFCPFNFYETWAQKVLVGNKCISRQITYRPLDYEPISSWSDEHVHLVIVGMSRMGIALAIEAAHIAHYPNFNYRRKKTLITFIDSNARMEMEQFKQAYANLFALSYSSFRDVQTGYLKWDAPDEKYDHLGKDFLDIEWQFVQGDIESPGVRRLLTKWTEEPYVLMTVAICLNQTHHSIASAVYLPRCIYEKDIPVLVQQRNTSAIVEKLFGYSLENEEEREKMRFKNLRPFGMLDDGLDLQMTDDLFAKRVNAVYDTGKPDELLDELPEQGVIDEKWRKLKTVKRWSNIYNANSIPTKLRSLGYLTEEQQKNVYLCWGEINGLAEVEHNRWNVEELLLGYRPVYLEEQEAIRQNPDLKKRKRDYEFAHADIRPYHDLDEGTKMYDIKLSRHLPLIMNGVWAGKEEQTV